MFTEYLESYLKTRQDMIDNPAQFDKIKAFKTAKTTLDWFMYDIQGQIDSKRDRD